LVEEFRLAEEARRELGGLGWSLEPWLAVRLARTESDFLKRELSRLGALRASGRAATMGAILAESITRIRQTLGRRVGDMRAVLEASTISLDPIQFELTLALLVRDGLGKATDEAIRARALEVNRYLRLLEAKEAPPAPEASATPSSRPLPEGVDAELLADLRNVEAFLRALGPSGGRIEFWELFSVAVRDRRWVERATERLRARVPDDLEADLIRFFEFLLDLRQKQSRRAQALRKYLSTLPIGGYSADTMELAIAFIVASPEGARRLDQWLEDPERHRREAAIRVEGVIGRAQKYLHALRASA
jgi:hypothetical protein